MTRIQRFLRIFPGSLCLLALFGLASPIRAASDLYKFEPNEAYPRRFVDRPYTVAQNMSEIRLGFNYEQGNEQFNDAGKFLKVPYSKKNMYYVLNATYGYTYYFDLSFRIPYIARQITDETGPNQGMVFKGAGIGDAEFEMTYQLQNTGRFFIAGIIGAKLPGSENTNTEGAGLTTGSGTLDFFFKVPFKKAWRRWSLGGMSGYRFFGRDKVSAFRFGNRLDFQLNAVLQFNDYVAFQPEMVFWTEGASGLSGIQKPGEQSPNQTSYHIGGRLMLNPAPWMDAILSYHYPLMGTNSDKYSVIFGGELAFRF